jgi:hypothetical protein
VNNGTAIAINGVPVCPDEDGENGETNGRGKSKSKKTKKK